MTENSDGLLTVDALRSMIRGGSLGLQSRQLLQLPLGIGSLASDGSRVTSLDLSFNELCDLSSEIGRLTHLEYLDLSGNRLTSLPTEIGMLKNLKVLILAENLISDLPSELFSLDFLQELDLQDNRLRNIPLELGSMRQLHTIDLRHNFISHLPSRAAVLLASSKLVRLESNPLPDPIPQLVARGQKALAHYVAALDDAVETFEAKLQIVGEGNVGKSSLLAALRGEPFVENRETTHGIEIDTFEVKHAGTGNRLTLHTWDFGGQEVYRITHQFFFGQRSLFVLAWNPREGVEQDAVESWIRRIRLRVGAGATIIVVSTHCDTRRAEIDFASLQVAFSDLNLRRAEIDSKTGTGISDLRALIAESASALPQVGQKVSSRWGSIRDQILGLAATDPQISFERFVGICTQNSVLDPGEARTVAEWLHDLGQIVHYSSDEGLRDVVVLNPEWLTKAIGKILEDTLTRDNLGVLDHARLYELWSTGDRSGYAESYHPYFLRLMEKFEVCYRLPDTDRSLVAQLVPYEKPLLPWERGGAPHDGHRALRITCKMSESAPGLISWLTVRHHRSSVNMHWRNGIFLRHPIADYASEALIEQSTSTTVELEVRAPSPDLMFNVLRDSIEDVICLRWPGLGYELRVPCPTDGPCKGDFPLKALGIFLNMGDQSIRCPYCFEQHDIAGLLTGFAPKSSLVRELSKLTRRLAKIEGHVADMAHAMRRVIKAIGTEVSDCPRLMTLTPTAGLNRVYSTTLSYELTLWCEHSDCWHPLDTFYKIELPKGWVIGIAPYLRFIAKSLKIATTVASTGLFSFTSDWNMDAVKAKVELMEEVVHYLPSDPGAATESEAPLSDSQLTPAEGHALRGLRALLFDLDKNQYFGGLRRVQDPSGSYLWICQDHYPLYDPGLPSLPSHSDHTSSGTNWGLPK
ncbi:COR domain-containing protein [Catellatospora sp. KI3]|uniref:COR domain-containing protein n=1 Tax=Catellatospora sp. KI3 TaxID=3041620 RepID=UPI00248309CF|nr:COR domain-containing protein [Catellatospora sp. KI3]MDI1463429.1 COR domain-containing protein [Catellatospora sp. KI3]